MGLASELLPLLNSVQGPGTNERCRLHRAKERVYSEFPAQLATVVGVLILREHRPENYPREAYQVPPSLRAGPSRVARKLLALAGTLRMWD